MAVINKILVIVLGLSYLLYSQNIKYFLGYELDESNKYGVNGRFLYEIDNITFNLIDRSKENLWINRVKAYQLNGYYKVEYKNESKIYAEYIKTTPFEYRYGKVHKPKEFNELNLAQTFYYDDMGRLIKHINTERNSSSTYTYSNNMVKKIYIENNKVLNISKSYYKDYCTDRKRIEEYVLGRCVNKIKLLVGIVEFDINQEVLSYLIYKYNPSQTLTYDKDGKFLNKYPAIFEMKNDKSESLSSEVYQDLNLTEEWKYIKKIDKLNAKGGVK